MSHCWGAGTLQNLRLPHVASLPPGLKQRSLIVKTKKAQAAGGRVTLQMRRTVPLCTQQLAGRFPA